MTKNEPLDILQMDLPPSDEPEELRALLAERISRYTMGDSASVPVDTARHLLEGIRYCVALGEKICVPFPPDARLRQRWQAGVNAARRLAARAKFLLREAQRLQPPVTNLAFRESLNAIPTFFRAYDPDFFAQEIPCALDYPLCHPVGDALVGAEYLLDYLRRWLIESAFLRYFSEGALLRLYKRYYLDYEDLVVNLYQPAAELAVLCALAGKPVRELTLDQTDIDGLSRLLANDEAVVQAALISGAERVYEELRMTGARDRKYLKTTILDYDSRLNAARSSTTHPPMALQATDDLSVYM